MCRIIRRRSCWCSRPCGISRGRSPRGACGWTTSGWTTRRTRTSFRGEVLRAVGATARPASSRPIRANGACSQDMLGWQDATGVPVEIREDTRFLCGCRASAPGRMGGRQYRMEFFYREMRRETGLLMEGDEPVGGQWNFDAENRASAARRDSCRRRRGASPPMTSRARSWRSSPSASAGISATVDGFAWPVTAREARPRSTTSSAHRLPLFGDYQDAMADGQPTHVPRPDLDQPEHRPARPDGGLPRGGRRLARRPRAAQCRGGLHPPDPRLAGICARPLLAPDAGLCGAATSSAPTRPLPAFYWGAATDDALHRAGRRRRPATSPTPTTSSA